MRDFLTATATDKLGMTESSCIYSAPGALSCSMDSHLAIVRSGMEWSATKLFTANDDLHQMSLLIANLTTLSQ